MIRPETKDILAKRYGWKPWDIVRMTPGEIHEYLRGASTNQEKEQRAAKSQRQTPPSADQRRREQEALQQYA